MDAQPLTQVNQPITYVDAATREMLEDHTLGFTPRHQRKWPIGVVPVPTRGGHVLLLADRARPSAARSTH